MTLDLSSLFHATVGFDDIASILNNFANAEKANTYPPYNISKIDEYTYRISIAVAGFERKDINIILEKDILTIKSSGKKKNVNENFIQITMLVEMVQMEFLTSGTLYLVMKY